MLLSQQLNQALYRHRLRPCLLHHPAETSLLQEALEPAPAFSPLPHHPASPLLVLLHSSAWRDFHGGHIQGSRGQLNLSGPQTVSEEPARHQEGVGAEQGADATCISSEDGAPGSQDAQPWGSLCLKLPLNYSPAIQTARLFIQLLFGLLGSSNSMCFPHIPWGFLITYQ